MAGFNGGNEVITGTHGKLWLDNVLLAEMKEVNLTVNAEEEEVFIGMDKDRKLTGLTGEGTYILQKVYSRARPILREWVKGKDKRMTLTFQIDDPDAVGGQIERITVGGVWIKSLNIIKWSKGAKVEEEFPFGFRPSLIDWQEEIK